jgi:hypothetical protein
MAFFLKNQCIDPTFAQFSSVLNQTRQILPNFSSNFLISFTMYVPMYVHTHVQDCSPNNLSFAESREEAHSHSTAIVRWKSVNGSLHNSRQSSTAIVRWKLRTRGRHRIRRDNLVHETFFFFFVKSLKKLKAV